jgi:hypothetical protein
MRSGKQNGKATKRLAAFAFGSLAREAFPKILPLLKTKDDDDRTAARIALKKIDPAAAAQAGVK